MSSKLKCLKCLQEEEMRTQHTGKVQGEEGRPWPRKDVSVKGDKVRRLGTHTCHPSLLLWLPATEP